MTGPWVQLFRDSFKPLRPGVGDHDVVHILLARCVVLMAVVLVVGVAAAAAAFV